MKTTVSVVCYHHKILTNGESPVMLRICKGGKRTMKSLGISVHARYWDFATNQPKRNCPNRNCGAILEAWAPGVQGGKAVADILFGAYNPSGKLAISFPVNVGQIPNLLQHEADRTSVYAVWKIYGRLYRLPE